MGRGSLNPNHLKALTLSHKYRSTTRDLVHRSSAWLLKTQRVVDSRGLLVNPLPFSTKEGRSLVTNPVGDGFEVFDGGTG